MKKVENNSSKDRALGNFLHPNWHVDGCGYYVGLADIVEIVWVQHPCHV